MLIASADQSLLMWIAFALTYVGIALGGFPKLVLDRTGIALLGAIAMLFLHGVTIRQAAELIDYPTILLLFGLMIFSAQLRVAGFYSLTGRRLMRLVDRPRILLAGLIAVSALLSALLANDIVCLAFTPLVCDSLLRARRDPIPYLVALATASNIGSAATIIGNPQNMYIGTVAGLQFGHFALTMLPATLTGLALCYLAIASLFRRRLYGAAGADIEMAWTPGAHESETLVPTSLPLQTSAPQADAYLIVKTLTVLGIVVCCFLVVRGPNASQSRAIAALVGAGVLLCSHRAKAARLYQFVDWNLILLFLGLFVVNGAMTEHGLTDALLGGIRRGGVRLDQPLELSAVTLVLSNLVSNVPAVLLLQPTIHIATAATHSDYLWYLLALVSTWAGNLTLIGSIANLIVAESAAAYGVNLSLKTYCTVGIPLTLATIGLGTGWLVWIHRIGWL